MRDPPKLTDMTIRAALHTHYGLAITSLTFLHAGNDAASFVYRADTADGTRNFLKVRSGSAFNASSLAVPHFLHQQGIPHIIPPLPTVAQTLWGRVDDFALSLYPYVDARPAADAGLTTKHWHALGTTLRQIHASRLPPDLRQITPHETFVPSRRHVLTQLEPHITHHDPPDSIQRELAEFWRSQEDRIRVLIDRADTLGNKLRAASLPRVLCHADLHTWNVLLDTARQMWIVDWDETVLAPKECDLMFVIDGIGRDLVRPYETTSFLKGYGEPAIDSRALEYYRYAWAVQDIAAYAEEVFLSPDASAQARRAAARGFMDQFAPGNIVEIALASESSPS